MRKRIRIMLLLCVSLLLTTACSKESLRNCIVHEWPEKETSEIILNLKFDEDLPLYKEITVDTKAASTRATTKVNSDLYDLRRIIKTGDYEIGLTEAKKKNIASFVLRVLLLADGDEEAAMARQTENAKKMKGSMMAK